MSDEVRGQAIKERMERIGLSVRQFSEKSGIDRATVSRALAGESGVRATTFGAIEKALSDIEYELGMDRRATASTEDADVIEFHVSGNFGVDVVVRGPIRDAEQLQAAVSRLIEQMQKQQEAADEGGS